MVVRVRAEEVARWRGLCVELGGGVRNGGGMS